MHIIFWQLKKNIFFMQIFLIPNESLDLSPSCWILLFHTAWEKFFKYIYHDMTIWVTYRIRSNTMREFYFPKWLFGAHSIQICTLYSRKLLQKLDFWPENVHSIEIFIRCASAIINCSKRKFYKRQKNQRKRARTEKTMPKF